MKFILMLLLFFPISSMADWKKAVADSLLFATGIAVSFAVHELGHELVARAYGEKLDWHMDNGLEWTCRHPCKHLSSIAIAGNAATAITGELLLLIPNRENPFIDGMQSFNAIRPISYVYKDLHSPYRDYEHVNNTAEIAIAIHAASIGYRQFSGRLWSIAPKHRGIQLVVNF